MYFYYKFGSTMKCLIFLLFLYIGDILSATLNDLNLPPEHIPYLFNQFPDLANACKESINCPYKSLTNSKVCWGYENNCPPNSSYHVRPKCPGDHRGWVKTKQAQIDTFYTQADFGYVKEQIQDLMVMCEATYPYDSSLECSKYL
ncbi:hypothetical protein KGM_214191A, partial [Danaus plexippus plexippus]